MPPQSVGPRWKSNDRAMGDHRRFDEDTLRHVTVKHMWSKKTSGLIGMALGALWLLNNLRHFTTQGYVAITMPILIFALGVFYYRQGSKDAE